ncbi:helix-turn-helix domain-containing protein [Sphingobium sp. EM0848]|uniref:helix-turn-helix domain-containing protein n=1 Tax=Sphingobium sp. EM0848 TaxID=2743473 RepID=UPI00159C829B|nr:helix-turn-helix domain-containing protein [Sphingobium sp. EM0848]
MVALRLCRPRFGTFADRPRDFADFANVLGETPAARLTRIRLIEARRLLGGERVMRDDAANVGYRSQAAFNRAFRRQYCETPAAVRRSLRGKG